MMRNAYHCDMSGCAITDTFTNITRTNITYTNITYKIITSGGEGWCANSTCRRVLVTHADGHQSVQEIKNDFGVNPSDVDTMIAKLQEQGVCASSSNSLPSHSHMSSHTSSQKSSNKPTHTHPIKPSHTSSHTPTL